MDEIIRSGMESEFKEVKNHWLVPDESGPLKELRKRVNFHIFSPYLVQVMYCFSQKGTTLSEN